MHAKVYSAQTIGLHADIIDVEVDISKGLHSFSIVGLPDKAVEEAKDRINAAIKNSGFKSPARGNRKIIISLAPGDIKKEGTHFDLAIAIGYLLANQEIKFDPADKLFLGELSLDGKTRHIKGVLLLLKKARESGFKEIYIPSQNAKEANLITGLKIYPCNNLKDIINHLSPNSETKTAPLKPLITTKIEETINVHEIDFADIKGQLGAKRGLEIAAAGGHNLAMFGPPGTGKTMLAKAFTGILPPLSFDEIIEVTGIHSTNHHLDKIITIPPLRSPHHTASYVSLVGGGSWPKPGEITLAHRGVLFLDEFPEFDKRVIEALRQPLEDRIISISRAKGSMIFPAHFILIATMNPCPCGHKNSHRECVCTQSQIERYNRKLSGPIIDRIDLWLPMPQVSTKDLSSGEVGEKSAEIKRRVTTARNIQNTRFQKLVINTNGEMSPKELEKYAPLSAPLRTILNEATDRLNLSARAYHRLIKIARTIADLEEAEQIAEKHLLEAIQYRPKN